jgi:hypothetical protein
VGHSGVQKLGLRVDALAIETRKDGRRRSAVKAFVVKADPNLQSSPHFDRASQPKQSQ